MCVDSDARRRYSTTGGATGLRSTYHRTTGSMQRAACDAWHAPCTTRLAARVRHKPEKGRFFYAPSASAANALQSNLSGMRPMHACARCVLRPQPTYRACVHGRERAQPAGTHLGLRPNQPFELQTPRPTGAGADAKPNLRCVASYVPVSAAGGAVPLTVSRNALCSRPTRCPQTTPTDRTQCDAHITPRVRRRRPKSAVCAVLRACRGMACTAARLMEERADDAGGRTSATAASYAASWLQRCASWRGVRLRRFGPIRCVARYRGCGQHSVTLRCP